jgi:hypothetical protein
MRGYSKKGLKTVSHHPPHPTAAMSCIKNAPLHHAAFKIITIIRNVF